MYNNTNILKYFSIRLEYLKDFSFLSLVLSFFSVYFFPGRPQVKRKDMNEDIRRKLHKLLDQMIDEDQPLGVLEEATTQDGVIKITSFRLTLAKRQETML